MEKSRRNFMKGFGSLIASSVAIPAFSAKPAKLPATNGLIKDEAYWQLVKDQFSVRPGYIMMNAANLCPSPYQVIEAVSRFNRILESDVSFQNRSMFADLEQKVLTALAGYLHVSPEEVIVSRNTSESNNIVVNGLDFGKGDEVLLWEQNHPTNLISWQERAKRMGFKVNVISLPAQPAAPEELLEHFEKAINPRTRMISFSHVSNVSGIRLPAAQICSLARAKGIMSMVDGAQSFGCLHVDLKSLGCDFYTGSAHKWLMGPKETGVLFVKKENIHRLWPNMVAAGYHADAQEDIRRLSSFGQRHEASLAGFLAVLEFHQKIGQQEIENRALALSRSLREKITQQLLKVDWVTPENEDISANVQIFRIPGMDGRNVFQQLYEGYQIACAPTGGIRLSPHIYNDMADVERVGAALKKIVMS